MSPSGSANSVAVPDAIGVGTAVAVADRTGVDVGVGTAVGVGWMNVAVGTTGVAVSGAGFPLQAAIMIARVSNQTGETR